MPSPSISTRPVWQLTLTKWPSPVRFSLAKQDGKQKVPQLCQFEQIIHFILLDVSRYPSWAGNSAIWGIGQDNIKHKASFFFYFNPWIKPAFCIGKAEKSASLAAAESMTAKWQHIHSRPNLSTSRLHLQMHSPRPGLQWLLMMSENLTTLGKQKKARRWVAEHVPTSQTGQDIIHVTSMPSTQLQQSL